MIIFRYLTREVLTTLIAISSVLLVIIMSGRFVKYMARAAQGMREPSALVLMIAYRIPEFLQLILPLGLFLGILLAHGRMYLDSEMAVLTSSGVSQQRLFAYSLLPATLVAVVLAALSMLITPYGIQQVDKLRHQQNSITQFDTLNPGRFQSMRQGDLVVYAAGISNSRELLEGVFVSDSSGRNSNGRQQTTVLIAKSGRQLQHEDGSRYLVLEDGYRYDGVPGQADYRRTRYDTYAVLMPSPSIGVAALDHEAMPTSELFGQSRPDLATEMHWRTSIPLLAFVVTLIAVPLARVNPRQGRFLKLLPAILLYLSYLGLLITAREAMGKGQLPTTLGLWPIHVLYALIGALLLYWHNLMYWLSARRAQAAAVQHA